MKVDKLICQNQPIDWFGRITAECGREYPMYLIDIDRYEQVVDMGCNVGGFSEAFKNRFNNILAIDASSYNVGEYKKHHSNKILHKAVSSKDNEIVKLKKFMGNNGDDTNSGNFSIAGFIDHNNNHGMSGEEFEEVETISLETVLNMVENIGLLKIDVEGAEYDVLYQKDLTKINYITGEFHNFLGKEKLDNLFNWIKQTHNEIHSQGGLPGHYLKTWKRK
jgi:FkbM family methyltransferase